MTQCDWMIGICWYIISLSKWNYYSEPIYPTNTKASIAHRRVLERDFGSTQNVSTITPRWKAFSCSGVWRKRPRQHCTFYGVLPLHTFWLESETIIVSIADLVTSFCKAYTARDFDLHERAKEQHRWQNHYKYKQFCYVQKYSTQKCKEVGGTEHSGAFKKSPRGGRGLFSKYGIKTLHFTTTDPCIRIYNLLCVMAP